MNSGPKDSRHLQATLPDRIPEILAPAGGRAQFFAAMNAGADAVYLGLKDFNARGRAENFSLDDLRELVPFAKKQKMKVLVTLNIILKDVEFPKLIDYLAELQWIGIEAVIIQDLGVARIVRQYFPQIKMHASTQMAVHNLSGVLQAHELGFKRVVVARELTMQELKLISQKVPDSVELEAFCHGSLCYSYSGLCFFSGAEDARSGNRGECAYTCRKPYKIISEPGHGFLFSMKDLDTSQDLEKLVMTGVHTFKIEGRKKDAQYVSSVVSLYRQQLNAIFGFDTVPSGRSGLKERDFRRDLSFSFHRETTSFYMNGRYHENVIDLDNPTHKGIFVGKVKNLVNRSITFTTKEPLELYDGLRVELSESVYHAKPQHGQVVTARLDSAQDKYQNKVCQFSLREFKSGGKRASTTTKGRLIEVTVPKGVPLPSIGDSIYKVRSNELKRHTDALSQPKGPHRITPLKQVQLRVMIEELPQNELAIIASAYHHDFLLLSTQATWPALRPEKSASLKEDLQQSLSIFGSTGIAAQVDVLGDDQWFVPRKLIKTLKQQLSDKLHQQVQQYTKESAHKAQAACTFPENLLKPNTAPIYHLKVDRIETIHHLLSYRKQHQQFQVGELIFEPKRAFLETMSPDDLFQTVFAKSKELGATLRFAIPTVLRMWDEPLLKRWVKAYHAQGGRAYEVGNLGAFDLLNKWGAEPQSLTSDFTLYALNNQAVQALASMGLERICLSIEDDQTSLKMKLKQWPLTSVKPEIILYKDTPLFIGEACSLTALHNGCPSAKVCGYRSLEIENHEGERFFVAHESCKSVVYGEDAYGISQHRAVLQQSGVANFRIDFLTRPYDEAGVHRVLSACISGQAIPQTQPANFSRELI